jgi:predicted Zn-dependent protease
MIGQSRLLTELSKPVKGAKADGISVCAHAQTRRVFRFAYGAIHQDLVQERVGVTVKIVDDRRVGIASTDTLGPASLARCVRAAEAIAAHAPERDGLPELPRGHRLAASRDYVEATARVEPAACVSLLKRLFHLCKGAGAVVEDEFCVVNSSGVACYAASTISGAKVVTMYHALAGYASGVARDLDRLGLDALLKTSLGQSLHRQEPAAIPMGTYEVILEPEAVAELVAWLGYTAFGAKSVEERTSCLAGRMGERLFDPQITIADDGHEPLGLRLPFDFEGTPKQRVALIDRGRAQGIVYDTTYGQRFGHPSTGHGMPPDDVEGPMPLHLVMAPGEVPVPEMIRACKRGLLIPRFHYVNGLLNPREALMTGLTREGCFLIEDGRVTQPVRTMRFTQSLLEAFSRVLGVSRERRLVAEPSQELGCAVVPALHLERFAFTGRSE